MTLDSICAEIAKQQARGRLVERIETSKAQLERWWQEARANGYTFAGGHELHKGLAVTPPEMMGVPVHTDDGVTTPRLVVWMERVEVAL